MLALFLAGEELLRLHALVDALPEPAPIDYAPLKTYFQGVVSES